MHRWILIVFLHALSILAICQSSEYIEQPFGMENTNKYRLPNDTIPIHYNIRLHPQLTEFNNTFEGDVRIDFKVLQATTNVVLHSRNLMIDETKTSVENGNDVFKPEEHIYDSSTDHLKLRFAQSLRPRTYTLNVKFKGELSSHYNEFFKSYYENGNDSVPFVATHFQKANARCAFPCWDEPALKATFNISLKHSANYTALANMPAYLVERDEFDGKDWTHFDTTPVMSTNILGFVVSDFDHVSNSDNTIRVWADKCTISNVAYFMTIIEEATVALKKYMNSTMRVPKMDHVIVPRYVARALENWGLIIYLNAAVPLDNEHFTTKVTNVMTVTHELSHQWFGNLVSPSWWKYFWMSEGMATYLKAFITDKLFKEWRLMDEMIHSQLEAFSMDETRAAMPINEDVIDSKGLGRNRIFVYVKPALMFWMLSHIVGEDVFRDGLINYIDAHEYGSVTSNDLWESMEIALNRSDTPRLEFQVKEMMDSWIEQAGYPLVTVIRNYTTGDVTVSQGPTILGVDKTQKEWWVPINYATKSAPDFATTRPRYFLRPGDENIVIQGIDIDDWIIVNLQQTGYYRVNYDETNWRRIIDYLNNDDHNKIHVGNRIQLLDTAFHLTQAKLISPDIFLNLANYLRRETDAVVWNYLLDMLSKIEKYIKNPRSDGVLKPYILGLMSGILDSIDYDEVFSSKDDFSKRTKIEALSLACELGDSKCRAKAAARLDAYLEDPEANRVPTVAWQWVFCTGLANANQTTWDRLFELRMSNGKEAIHETLYYFSCAENPDIILNYLNMSVTENATILQFVKPVDILLLFNNDIVANVGVEIDFIIRNIEIIKSITDRPEDIFDSLIWRISAQDHLDKLKTFLQRIGINKSSEIHYREQALRNTDDTMVEILQWLKGKKAT